MADVAGAGLDQAALVGEHHELVRSRRPSLVRMLDTCDFTVAGPMKSSPAISALLDPRATATTTSRSRSVRRSRRPATAASTVMRSVNRPMRRQVIDRASSAPPSATVRTAMASWSGGCP